MLNNGSKDVHKAVLGSETINKDCFDELDGKDLAKSLWSKAIDGSNDEVVSSIR